MLLASTFVEPVTYDRLINKSCLTMSFARDIPSELGALVAMYEPVDSESQGIAQNARKVGARAQSHQREGARVTVI